jgi:capsular exopolysaccharide synthesis family protein
VDFSAFLRPLRRWWWLLLAATLLAAGSSYWLLRQQPPRYAAATTLMIGRAFDDPNPTGNELSLGQQLAETYADLALRRPVREQTMAALGLSRLPEYSAVPLPNRQLLQITVIDTDPYLAQAVANELANQLILQSPTAPKPEEQERQAFINNQLTSLQANIEQTEAELVAKRAELEAAFSAVEISRLQGEIAALQTKLNTLQSNYAALLDNTGAGASNTIAVIEPAALPTAPTDSGQAQMILAVSAIALALAAGTAYALEYLDSSVRTADDLSEVSSLASLPSIPRLAGRRGEAPVIGQNGPQPLASDAFRALRTSLYAATADLPGKILLITSAAPREGKSTIAANLAAVLAQGEKRVLLIDADLRRPRQHVLFGLPATEGLAELLSALDGRGFVNGNSLLLEQLIRRTHSPRLDLIVAGSHLDGAADRLGSDAMKLLLEALKHTAKYDYIIVDSPALLATADGLILSTLADGVLVVAGAGVVSRKRLELVVRRLSAVNANIVGVVLNREATEIDRSYYAYYHR